MSIETLAVTIRPATEEDWAALKSIRLDALRDSPAAFGLSYAIASAYSEQQWRDRASSKTPPEFLLAIRQGQAVGLIGDSVGASNEYHLIAMWVRPECRGAGIADRLVGAIKARAVARGYRRVVLSVAPDNVSAVALYQRQGFRFLPEWEPLASQPGVSVQKMEWRDDH